MILLLILFAPLVQFSEAIEKSAEEKGSASIHAEGVTEFVKATVIVGSENNNVLSKKQ
jgi:hypothetical protein